MHHKARFPNAMFHAALRPEGAALAILLTLLFFLFLLLFLTLTAPPAQAQTFKVIYTFTGGADGELPYAGLTIDRAGNLYGTTAYGGQNGARQCVTSYRTEAPTGFSLRSTAFKEAMTDFSPPGAGLIVDREGSLFGTTYQGGGNGCYNGCGCGTIFKLRPAATACGSTVCPWTETVLYRFSGSDGDVADGLRRLRPSGQSLRHNYQWRLFAVRLWRGVRVDSFGRQTGSLLCCTASPN